MGRQATVHTREPLLGEAGSVFRLSGDEFMATVPEAGPDGERARSLRQGDFRLEFQPQCRLCDGRITGVEALLRWRLPDGTVPASPERFIPVAEGVESPAMLARLSLMGCDAVQGHAIAQPLPSQEMRRWQAGSMWAGRR